MFIFKVTVRFMDLSMALPDVVVHGNGVVDKPLPAKYVT